MIPLKILSIRRNSEISSFSKIYPFSKISNSIVNDFSYISFRCTINGCEIGKFCSIASGVKIGLGIHPINFVSTSPLFYAPSNPLNYKIADELNFKENEQVLIGHDVWVGTNAVILDGITIGNGAIIGANSIVTKDVAPYSIVGGVPAKEIKKRFSDRLIKQLNTLKWWNMPIDFFKQKKVKLIFSTQLNQNSLEQLELHIASYNLKK
jgi:acetyltransferase-like isoleucine patch superfamily enzyme